MASTNFPHLIVHKGPNPGETFELSSNEMVIGREPGTDLQIDSPAVSRRHARLVRQGDHCWIEDLGSSNGTFVKGQRLRSPIQLHHGDRITLGHAIELEFRTMFEAATVVGADPTVAGDQTALEPEAARPENQAPPESPPAEKVPPREAPEPAPTRAASPPQAVSPPAAPGGPRLAATQVGAEPQPPPPQLIVTIAGSKAQTYTLTQPILTIGRAPENDIVIQSPIVSRKHARLEQAGGSYRLVPLPEASNPVLYEGRPLNDPHDLRHDELLRIGGQDPGVMVTLSFHAPATAAAQAQPIQFKEKNLLQLGRAPDNDVVLDSPTVSRYHAQLERVGQRYRVRDLQSSNGTFVNGERIEAEAWLKPGDTVRVGPHRFLLGQDKFDRLDETQGLRVEVLGLNKWVRKDLNILQEISLVFEPREFVVVVGQSGGGKSTLVDAIAGYRPATHGRVLVNGTNVYENFDAIRNDIGFVPQKDIIHMELTVYQALDYAARLRLPADTTREERHQRVMQVLDDLDLVHRKDVQISGLSGGQQKRVSIGVELLTEPGLFFLDEPSSGLDPGTETALMQLMRNLADGGRTIILITHATKNVMLADKVVFLARGGYLAWFGPPEEALEYFNQFRSERDRRSGPMEFDQIYAILDDPDKGDAKTWADRYQKHRAYHEHIVEPLRRHGHAPGGNGRQPAAEAVPQAAASPAVAPKRRPRVSGLRQFMILSSRNLRILTRDRFSLFLMLAAAPLIGLQDFILSAVLGRNPFAFEDGDAASIVTILFLLSVYGVMVGGLSQMRELVKERPIYLRERLVNLKILPYLLSKVWIAILLALYQTSAYMLIRYLAFDMPGGWLEAGVIFITLWLATMSGMMLGLFASALAPNSNAAPLIVILFMIPQFVLGGALIPLPSALSAPTATRWAFEAFMGVTGVGSDVARDPCWQLDAELRDSMDLDAKEANGCNCMGLAALRQDSCNFPGLGQFYDPVIDDDPPVEPVDIGDPPPEPVIPPAPEEPEDQNDSVAVAQYLDSLSAYQDEVEAIQDAYRDAVSDYQSQADVFKAESIAYQEDLAEYEISRNAAVGKAEAVIENFQDELGWTFIDKNDTENYWNRILTTWIAQSTLIGVLFVGIVFLTKRLDRT